MTGCKGLFANSKRTRNKAQQAWSAPFSHHNPDLIHHMSPWVTILELRFIAPHFPRPALPPAAFLCFCVRPRKLPILVDGTVFLSLCCPPSAGVPAYRSPGRFTYWEILLQKCSKLGLKPFKRLHQEIFVKAHRMVNRGVRLKADRERYLIHTINKIQ